jgi:hypothetical protein
MFNDAPRRGAADRAAQPAPTILLTGSAMTGQIAAWAAEAFGAPRNGHFPARRERRDA